MTTQNVHLTYQPLPKQAAAHALNAKYRGFCGGWGNGKTSWGCVETFIMLNEFPGMNFIIARKTRPELRATTWDMFLNGDEGQNHGWHGVPRELIAYNNKSDLHLVLRNKSQVFGLPLDDPKKIENYNLGGFWIDQAEEVEEDIFLKFHGRLRQRAAPREGLLTFNPAGHNWLWRRMIDSNRSEIFKRQYACVEATTYDNPNLPDDYFEQFEGLSSMPRVGATAMSRCGLHADDVNRCAQCLGHLVHPQHLGCERVHFPRQVRRRQLELIKLLRLSRVGSFVILKRFDLLRVGRECVLECCHTSLRLAETVACGPYPAITASGRRFRCLLRQRRAGQKHDCPAYNQS